MPTRSLTHLQVLCHAESLKPFSALPVTGKSPSLLSPFLLFTLYLQSAYSLYASVYLSLYLSLFLSHTHSSHSLSPPLPLAAVIHSSLRLTPFLFYRFHTDMPTLFHSLSLQHIVLYLQRFVLLVKKRLVLLHSPSTYRK